MQSFAYKSQKRAVPASRCPGSAAPGRRPTACCFTATPLPPREIRIITENPEFAAAAAQAVPAGLFASTLTVCLESGRRDKLHLPHHPDAGQAGSGSWTCWAMMPGSLALHVNFGRAGGATAAAPPSCGGPFWPGAVVTDPEKRYHLELSTSHTPGQPGGFAPC